MGARSRLIQALKADRSCSVRHGSPEMWPPDGATSQPTDHSNDAASLYDKLEHIVLPLYAYNRDDFIEVMRHAIALNGSFFNTHRMLQQYVLKAYI